MDESDLCRIADAYVADELSEKDDKFIEQLAEATGDLRDVDPASLSPAQRSWLLDILDRLDS